MEKDFYDVKAKAKVTTKVVAKVAYPNGRYAFKGLTKDGRNLTCFVKKADYDKAKVPEA